jgi:murein DD-endopeptidase MepM/ murein hydrolase activator NlpD
VLRRLVACLIENRLQLGKIGFMFMWLVRRLFGLIFVLLLILGVTYYFAGRADGPVIAINQPALLGQAGTLDVTVDAPGAQLDELTIQIEQRDQTFPVLTLVTAPAGSVTQEGADRLHIRQAIGKKWLPELQSGPARITVTATRPVLRGLRHVSARASSEIQVRLDPPRIGVISTHHFINLGGSEMVVYRVTPPDVESGVRVGEIVYPGFAAAGAGAAAADTLKIAFFALPYNLATNTPMELYARDAAGNEGRAQFEHQVFRKVFRRSTIPLDDAFLSRVVPAILQQSPDSGISADDLLPAFLKINNDLRRANNNTIAALAKKTSPKRLWSGAFQPMGGAQVESAFADFRTYFYGGKEVDRQVHLGFDLAKTANAPVEAANDGKVIYAGDLGIYGNCAVVDHGMGVQSLYAHLSSFDAQEGQDVRKGQVLGRSGQTGLAGGDHLHFSMLVNGQFVNATEWWDPHWIEDRIERKLREASATATR